MPITFPTTLDTLTDPTASDKLNSVTVPHATQHADLNNIVEALEAKVGVNDSAVTTSLDYIVKGATGIRLFAPREKWNVAASAATGTISVDLKTAGAWYFTSDATANWTLNFRGDSGATFDSLVGVGESVTVAFLATQGGTAYYASAFQVDGSSVTPIWSGGSAPSAGNANSVDAYIFTIIKTAATPTYEVIASVTQFA
jgi:hypothetical protein